MTSDNPVQKRLLSFADRSALDRFWTFIYERHSIWFRRFVLEQPAPWTEDPMLKTYKFTNVYRELDRGTIYLLENVINRMDSAPEDEVWNIIVYRMFNRVSTFDHLGWKTLAKWRNPKNFRVYFDRLRKYGETHPLYTDAHMVCAYENFPGADKLERFEHIFQGVLTGMDALMTVINRAKTLGTIHKALVAFPGIGPFLAYEMAVDISYCAWNNHGEDEWVNPGPGCQRGLKAIFPQIKPNDMTFRIKELREIQREEFARLDLPFFSIAYKDRELTLRNVEHCLCEFFKLHKAEHGTGRPRNKFTPQAQLGGTDFVLLKG